MESGSFILLGCAMEVLCMNFLELLKEDALGLKP